MDAVGASCEGDIRARVNQNSRRAVDGANCFYDSPGKLFEFPRRKIFLAQLDVIDAGVGSLLSAMQQLLAALEFGPGKLRAAGDVVKQQESVASRQLLVVSAEARTSLWQSPPSGNRFLRIRFRDLGRHFAPAARPVGAEVMPGQAVFQEFES